MIFFLLLFRHMKDSGQGHTAQVYTHTHTHTRTHAHAHTHTHTVESDSSPRQTANTSNVEKLSRGTPLLLQDLLSLYTHTYTHTHTHIHTHIHSLSHVQGNQIIANRKQVLRNAAAKPVDHYTTVRVPEAIHTHTLGLHLHRQHNCFKPPLLQPGSPDRLRVLSRGSHSNTPSNRVWELALLHCF